MKRIAQITLLLPFLFVYSQNAFCQKKKDLKKYQIKTVTETVLKKENSLDQTYKDSFQRFDEDGNPVEEIDYRKDGTVKERKTRKFDKEDNLIEETVYDGTGRIMEKYINEYNAYGEKISELEYDASNKLIRKTLFFYNNKGFKIEKQTYDENGKLIILKKYQYSS